MGPTKIDQGTIIILDVGKNVAEADEKNKKSFFDEAKLFGSRLIERYIMSQSKSWVSVMLLGSKETRNSMADACDGAFRRINILYDLQPPTWEMIRKLPETPFKNKGDWLDALIVAANHFKNDVSGVKIINRKIVLITNFKTPANLEAEQVQLVIDGFKEENFEVDIIGPDLDEEIKSEDVDIARKIVEETNGATAPFDYAMRYLLFHKKKLVNPVPWNVDLSIGPNVKIPVAAYTKLKDEPVVKSWKVCVKDPVSFKASTTEGIMKNKTHYNDENQTIVSEDNIIKGYNYGQKIIPFTDCDKSMLYEPGDKCLSVYGFTNIENIKWNNLCGDGLYYVFGRKGDQKAKHAFNCLVHCMNEMKLAGVVRRVYNKGNAPKMYALMPVIDSNNYVCLSMINLCYKDDIKNMSFPATNLKKYKCSDKQVNAFKDLIHAMDLTKAYDDSYDDTEAFPIAETVSPAVQYMLDCIAFRSLNPDKPLPKPRDELMVMFEVPPLISKKAAEPLDRIKELFPLKKVEIKKRVKKDEIDVKDNINGTSNSDPSPGDIRTIQLPIAPKSQAIDAIGVVDPVNDFKTLLDDGKTLSELVSDMTKAIEECTRNSVIDGNYGKSLECMQVFRTECVKTEPSFYNIWFKNFKTDLADRKRDELITQINDKNLGYILKSENQASDYDADTDSQVYDNDTVPEATELSIRDDINDLFDEL